MRWKLAIHRYHIIIILTTNLDGCCIHSPWATWGERLGFSTHLAKGLNTHAESPSTGCYPCGVPAFRVIRSLAEGSAICVTREYGDGLGIRSCLHVALQESVGFTALPIIMYMTTRRSALVLKPVPLPASSLPTPPCPPDTFVQNFTVKCTTPYIQV